MEDEKRGKTQRDRESNRVRGERDGEGGETEEEVQVIKEQRRPDGSCPL